MASGALVQHITSEDHVYVGTDRTIAIDVDDAAGAALSVAAFALTWELLTAADAVVVSKTTGAGTIVIGNGDGTNDRATVTIAAADTADLDPTKRYHHRLRRTDTGYVNPITVGTFEFVG